MRNKENGWTQKKTEITIEILGVISAVAAWRLNHSTVAFSVVVSQWVKTIRKKKNRKRTRSVKLCDKRQRIERENTMPPCDTNKRKVNISKRMRNAFEKHWFQRAHYLSFRFSAWDTPREFECWYERKSVSSGFLKNEIFFFVRDDRMRRVKSGSHARGNLLPLNSTVNSTVK